MSTQTIPTPAAELSETERELFNLAVNAGEIERKTLSPGQMAAASELVDRGVFVALKVKGQRHVRAYSVSPEALAGEGIVDVTTAPAEPIAAQPAAEQLLDEELAENAQRNKHFANRGLDEEQGEKLRLLAVTPQRYITGGLPFKWQTLVRLGLAKMSDAGFEITDAGRELVALADGTPAAAESPLRVNRDDEVTLTADDVPAGALVTRPGDNPTIKFDLAAAHDAGLPSREEAQNWMLTEETRKVLKEIAAGVGSKTHSEIITQGLRKRGIIEEANPVDEPKYYRPTAIGYGLAGLPLPAWREVEAREYYRAYNFHIASWKVKPDAVAKQADKELDEVAAAEGNDAGFYAVDIRPDEAVAVWFGSAVKARAHAKQFARGSTEVVSATEWAEREVAGSLLDRRNLNAVTYRVATSLDTDMPQASKLPKDERLATAAPAAAPAPAAGVSPGQLSLVLTGDEIKDEVLIAGKFAAGWVIGALDLLKQDTDTQKVIGRMINKKLVVSAFDNVLKKSIYSLSPAGEALAAAAPAPVEEQLDEPLDDVLETPARPEGLAHYAEVRQQQNLEKAGLPYKLDAAGAPEPLALDDEARLSDGREGRPTPHDYLLKLAPTLTNDERGLALLIGYGGRRFDALNTEQAAGAAGLCRKGALRLASETGGPINKYVVAPGLPEIIAPAGWVRPSGSEQAHYFLNGERDSVCTAWLAGPYERVVAASAELKHCAKCEKYVAATSTSVPVAEEHATNESLVTAAEVAELGTYQRDLLLNLFESPDLITRAANVGQYVELMFEAVQLFISAGWLNTYRGPKFNDPTEVQFTDRGRVVVDYIQQNYAAERALFAAHFTTPTGPVAEPASEPVGEGPAAAFVPHKRGDSISLNDPAHDFDKKNLMTQTGRGGRMFDTWYCTKCGIEGKRYGVSERLEVSKAASRNGKDECRAGAQPAAPAVDEHPHAYHGATAKPLDAITVDEPLTMVTATGDEVLGTDEPTAGAQLGALVEAVREHAVEAATPEAVTAELISTTSESALSPLDLQIILEIKASGAQAFASLNGNTRPVEELTEDAARRRESRDKLVSRGWIYPDVMLGGPAPVNMYRLSNAAAAAVADVDVVTAGSVIERGYDNETRDRILQLIANTFKIFIGENIPVLLDAMLRAGVEVTAWYDAQGASEVRVFLSTTEKSFGLDFALAGPGRLLKTLAEMADSITFDRPFDPFVITRVGGEEIPAFEPLDTPANLEKFATSVAVFFTLAPTHAQRERNETRDEQFDRVLADVNDTSKHRRAPRPMSPDPRERDEATHSAHEPTLGIVTGTPPVANELVDALALDPPAFPYSFETGVPGEGRASFAGISQRLYLAAHAPAAIPDWFLPDGPRPAEEPADALDVALVKAAATAASKFTAEELRELCDDVREEYREAARRWDVRRAARWPLYWADLILAESGNTARK
jgi:hypothetical protein